MKARKSSRLPRLLVLLLVLGIMWGTGTGRASSQAVQPPFAYAIYLPGWNLLAPAGQQNLSDAISQTIVGPLYTLQPDSATYETTDPGNLVPGQGYWAYFASVTAVPLPLSDVDTYSAVVPGGRCVMVGNPSTRASARVSGVDSVYVYSPALNAYPYLSENLVGVGRAAFACSAGDDEVATVTAEAEATGLDFPGCCAPTPFAGDGMARMLLANDSPAPLLVGMRGFGSNGEPLPRSSAQGFVPACATCFERTADSPCSQAALDGALTIPMRPGSYVLHIQTESRNVPDLQTVITVQPNTSYTLCYFIDAGRLQPDTP